MNNANKGFLAIGAKARLSQNPDVGHKNMRAIFPAMVAILTAWLVVIFTKSDHPLGFFLSLASPIGLAIAFVTLFKGLKCRTIHSNERMLWSAVAGLLVISFGVISIFTIIVVSIGGFGPPD